MDIKTLLLWIFCFEQGVIFGAGNNEATGSTALPHETQGEQLPTGTTCKSPSRTTTQPAKPHVLSTSTTESQPFEDELDEPLFASFITSAGTFLIDKSLVIPHILSGPKVVFISRPRQAAKSFNKEMLAAFFRNDLDSFPIFKGLKVGQPEYKAIRDAHMNKHPVIKLELEIMGYSRQKGLKAFRRACKKLNGLITDSFLPFQYLLKSSRPSRELKIFSSIIAKNATQEDFTYSLGALCKLLYDYHKAKPIILIDGAETPLCMAFHNDYYDEMEGVIVKLFTYLLNDSNAHFEKVILFGILPVFQSSRFKGWNMATSSVLEDPYFPSDFGLTVEDVHSMLRKNGVSTDNISAENLTKINGFRVEGKLLFDPRSAAEFVKMKLWGPRRMKYDACTETDAFRDCLTRYGMLPTLNFQRMLRGKNPTLNLTKHFNLKKLHLGTDVHFWTFFCHLGLISPEKGAPASKKVFEGKLKVTNKLIADWMSGIFTELSEGWTGQKSLDFDIFIQSLEAGREKMAKKWFELYLFEARKYVCSITNDEPTLDNIEGYVQLLLDGWSRILERNVTFARHKRDFHVFFPVKDNEPDLEVKARLGESVWRRFEWPNRLPPKT